MPVVRTWTMPLPPVDAQQDLLEGIVPGSDESQ